MDVAPQPRAATGRVGLARVTRLAQAPQVLPPVVSRVLIDVIDLCRGRSPTHGADGLLSQDTRAQPAPESDVCWRRSTSIAVHALKLIMPAVDLARGSVQGTDGVSVDALGPSPAWHR